MQKSANKFVYRSFDLQTLSFARLSDDKRGDFVSAGGEECLIPCKKALSFDVVC